MRNALFHALLFVGLAQHARAAGKAVVYPQGSQYIRFSGIVQAKVTWEKDIVPAGVDHTTRTCSEEFSSGPHPRSHLYVGVNPPWDTNPFFFELHHLVSDDCDTFFCNTNDSIMNLYFASAAYECFTSGDELCVLYSRGQYKPKVYLDLNNPGRTQIQQTQVGGLPGYAIKGGSASWIGDVNGNEVDVRADCQWVFGQGRDSRVGGYSWLNFAWNKTSPPDYNLLFSNTSATLTLTTKMFSQSLNRVVSSMTLSFEGTRNDTHRETNGTAFHDANPIQLNAENATMPEFRFVNGGNIYFGTGKGGWTAAATPLPQITAASSVSRGPSSRFVATTTSSNNNAGPTWGPMGNRNVVVTVAMIKVVVFVLGVI